MSGVFEALGSGLRLNGRLFRGCLDGVTGEQAAWRPEGGGNSFGFIALHLVDARFYLARQLGADVEDPFPEYADARSADDVDRLPTPESLLAAWDRVSPALMRALDELDPEQAAAEAPTRLPTDDPSTLGMVAFLTQHESYHIGQLSLLRRQLGHPAIAWT